MGSINAMIQWMKDREGKYPYTQVRPWSEGYYDCSAAVISALRAGSFLPAGPNEGWTGSLFSTTLPGISKQISRSECRKGDIFLSNPNVNAGHTGIFLDNNTIIHCNAGDWTISTTVADGRMGNAPFYYYRLNNIDEDNVGKATIDTNNVNSAAFHIAGWFVPKNSVAGQSIWLYFMDSTTDKELARVQGTRTFRDDVAQAYPNPNGNHVGFSFSAVTPRVLMGKKYYIMLRYSSAKDEIYMREKVYTAPAIVNQATLDEATVSGSTLTLRGWHVSSLRQNSYKHLMFLLENGKEVARFDATADSFQKSDDVASTFSSTIGQRSTSRFNTKYTIPASLKGKTITVLSRYAEGTLGTHSNSINYTFSKQIKL
ncbi:peptidoglycan amidohydrolase family protein [uncultured Enterococcus sp.]|uniref:peptidoglycan amidohydrolase family protein n=1 Tax=uncultured Enterococcus sp. TaxID=167972 RepID=UPI002AA66611|nr:peptidoglycan amidohydrolase family protein [uncultured Enterococcus sp.]